MPTNELKPSTSNAQSVHEFSRFGSQELFFKNGVKFWGTWRPKDIPFSPMDIYHTVKPEDARRIDLISYRYYRTPELWWVIAAANLIFFPAEELVEGLVIRVPEYNSLVTLGVIR